MAHGRYSYIAIAKETTHGQKATTINNFLKFSSGGFSLEKETIESKALTGRLLKYDTALGTRHWTGKIDGIEIDSVGQGLLFKSFFGKEAVSGTEAPYTHTFTIETNYDDYVSLSFEQYKTEWLKYFLGGRVKSLTFKGELNSIMTVDTEIIATDYEEGNISNKQTPTFGTKTAFRFYETTLKVNNVAIPIKSFEISMSESVEADYNFLGGKKPTGLLRGGIEASVKFQLNLSEISLDFWNDFMNETDKSVVLEMKKGDNELLRITLPRVKFDSYEESDGDEILTNDIGGVVLSHTNDSESIKLELINDRETEY